MLRVEVDVYRALRAPFMPELLGSHVDERLAVLAIEDLSSATWPPPYPEDVAPLMEAVRQVAAYEPPESVPALRPRETGLWERVAGSPEPFLSIGACSANWLRECLPALVAGERTLQRVGDDLVHYDIWGGNICFPGDRALLVDWGAAVRGDRRIDLAFAIFAIRVEAGRAIEVDFPEEGVYAAEIAVTMALQALEPLPPWAPPGSTLRKDQADLVAPALSWAAEKLGLPPPRPSL